MRLPLERTHPMRSAPDLLMLQRTGPIHAVQTRLGHPAWLVTGYDLVRALLDDDRLGRCHPEPEKASRNSDAAILSQMLDGYDTEQADHRRLRALLQPHFSPRRMRALRGRVEELTAGLLDEMAQAGPPTDLNTALALPLPIAVICELLGVPFDDREQFRAWTQAVGDMADGARSQAALVALYEYGRRLVARKRAEGLTDLDVEEMDVIGRLAVTDGVTDDEAAQIGMQLLFAGHETTVVALGKGVLWLMTDRPQWEALVDDPGLIDDAVEELLRAQSHGGDGLARYARTDLDVAGVPVKAGDLLLLDLGAANHDGSAFEDPDRLDVTRGMNGHLSFGHGSRYCLGAPLARIELQVALTQLVTRFPTLRLDAEVEELTFNTTVTGGLISLPIAW
ncbi:cytochrome P450 [Nonomuraea longicatena]|uniref:Cytochrome P450 n=1 Tax=Nonomuraea longicatena TaxID=83682 RepID=A0ABN1Q530_9ACTN